LADALRTCRLSFGVVGLFSLFMNVLTLALPLYMLQVYDRVLGTNRIETLILLTAMAVMALLVLGLLDGLRAAVMARLGRWLSAHLAPVFLATSVQARLQGDEAGLFVGAALGAAGLFGSVGVALHCFHFDETLRCVGLLDDEWLKGRHGEGWLWVDGVLC